MSTIEIIARRFTGGIKYILKTFIGAVTIILRRPHTAVKAIEPYGILLAVGALGLDIADQRASRVTSAWQLLTESAPGNSGKISALEYLRAHNEPLTGIDLGQPSEKEGVWLRGIDLSGSELSRSNFSRANLSRANLSFAWAEFADFSDTNLIHADLSCAFFAGVNFGKASLYHATLVGTSLHGADLSMIGDLSQKQLDLACGNESTKLPAGMTIRKCKEKDWPQMCASREKLSRPWDKYVNRGPTD